MQMAHANQWLHDAIKYTFGVKLLLIPYVLRCNKCLTFWGFLTYQILNLRGINLINQTTVINALLTAATAAILSIIIYNRL